MKHVIFKAKKKIRTEINTRSGHDLDKEFKAIKDQLIILPPTHLYVFINLGNEPVHVVRWQIPGGKENAKYCFNALSLQANEMPALKQATQQWEACHVTALSQLGHLPLGGAPGPAGGAGRAANSAQNCPGHSLAETSATKAIPTNGRVQTDSP